MRTKPHYTLVVFEMCRVDKSAVKHIVIACLHHLQRFLTPPSAPLPVAEIGLKEEAQERGVIVCMTPMAAPLMAPDSTIMGGRGGGEGRHGTHRAHTAHGNRE